MCVCVCVCVCADKQHLSEETLGVTIELCSHLIPIHKSFKIQHTPYFHNTHTLQISLGHIFCFETLKRGLHHNDQYIRLQNSYGNENQY